MFLHACCAFCCAQIIVEQQKKVDMLVREVEATKKRYRDLRNDKVSLVDQQVGAVCESSSLCEYAHMFCKVDKCTYLCECKNLDYLSVT